jgi:hypothetical protein
MQINIADLRSMMLDGAQPVDWARLDRVTAPLR